MNDEKMMKYGHVVFTSGQTDKPTHRQGDHTTSHLDDGKLTMRGAARCLALRCVAFRCERGVRATHSIHHGYEHAAI